MTIFSDLLKASAFGDSMGFNYFAGAQTIIECFSAACLGMFFGLLFKILTLQWLFMLTIEVAFFELLLRAAPTRVVPSGSVEHPLSPLSSQTLCEPYWKQIMFIAKPCNVIPARVRSGDAR